MSHSDEVIQVDSLINWNNIAKSRMVIDKDVILSKADSMSKNLAILDKQKSSQADKEFEYVLTEYRGILKIYQNFLENYSVVEYDNLKDASTLERWKQRLIDRKLSTEEFKTIYPDEKDLVAVHLQNTIKLVRSVISVEGMYARSRDKVEEKLRTKN